MDERALAASELERLLAAIAEEVTLAARTKIFAHSELSGKQRIRDSRISQKNNKRTQACVEFEDGIAVASGSASGFAEFLEKQNNDHFFQAALDLIYLCRSLQLLVISYPREAQRRAAKLWGEVKWSCVKCKGTGIYKLKDHNHKAKVKRCPDCEGTGQRALSDRMTEAVAFPVS